MDPTTDNEMKRVHKPNHPKCIPFLSSTFECLKCERKFNSPENLNVHMNSDHEEESHSSFTMWSDGSLTDALLFRCEICLNVYESWKDLEDHDDVQQEMNSMPRKRKPEPIIKESEGTKKDQNLSCTLCETKFTRKDNLQRHIKNKNW